MIPTLILLAFDAYLSFSLFWTPFSLPEALFGIFIIQVLFLSQFWLYFFFFTSDSEVEIKFEKPIQVFGFYSMGLISFLFSLTLLRDLVALIFLLFGNASQIYTEKVSFGVVGLSLIAFVIGALNARFRLISPRVEVLLPKLPPALAGLRIVQLSDVHLGTGPNTAHVKQMVDRALSLKPDIIALTGDIIDGMISGMGLELKELSRLNAPDGVYFVLGNHECYWKPLECIQAMKDAGIVPLLNAGIEKQIKGQTVFIAGVNDPHFATTGGEGAKVPVPPAGSVFNLVLMHQPQFAEKVAVEPYDLQLSGHTHAGQFFPWNLIVKRIYDISAGLGKIKNMWVYVNQGTGYWGPPVRLGTSGEVTELILVTRA